MQRFGVTAMLIFSLLLTGQMSTFASSSTGGSPKIIAKSCQQVEVNDSREDAMSICVQNRVMKRQTDVTARARNLRTAASTADTPFGFTHSTCIVGVMTTYIDGFCGIQQTDVKLFREINGVTEQVGYGLMWTYVDFTIGRTDTFGRLQVMATAVTATGEFATTGTATIEALAPSDPQSSEFGDATGSLTSPVSGAINFAALSRSAVYGDFRIGETAGSVPAGDVDGFIPSFTVVLSSPAWATFTPPIASYPFAGEFYSTVRCDQQTISDAFPNNAPPPGQSDSEVLDVAGCVLDNYVPIFEVTDAQNTPTIAWNIFNYYDCKKVGCLLGLQKEGNSSRKRSNRSAACGGMVSPAGYNCDEFPFASTKQSTQVALQGYPTLSKYVTAQNCSYTTQRVEDRLIAGASVNGGIPTTSVCAVRSEENSRQGGYLGNFYKSNRVIDGSTFAVKLVATSFAQSAVRDDVSAKHFVTFSHGSERARTNSVIELDYGVGSSVIRLRARAQVVKNCVVDKLGSCPEPVAVQVDKLVLGTDSGTVTTVSTPNNSGAGPWANIVTGWTTIKSTGTGCSQWRLHPYYSIRWSDGTLSKYDVVTPLTSGKYCR